MSPVPALSKCFKLIFDQLIPDQPVWDICCDHIKMDEIKKLPDFLFRQSQEILSVTEKDRVREIYVLDRTTHT